MGELSLQHPYLCRYYYGQNQYDSVRQLQEVLNEKCLSNLSVDGYFGRATEEVVKEHQRMNNLRVDGIVGPETLASLNKPKQNYESIPEKEYNGGMWSVSDDSMIGIPISDIGANMSSADEGYGDGLVQEEGIGTTPLFNLGISYDEINLPLPTHSRYDILTDRVYNPINSCVKAVDMFKNLNDCRDLLNLIANLRNTEYAFTRGNFISKMLYTSDRVGQNLGLFLGTGRFDTHIIEDIAQQGRILINNMRAVITELMKCIKTNIIDSATARRIKGVFNNVLNFAYVHLRRFVPISNLNRYVNGINNRIRCFGRLFPPLRLLSAGLGILPLLTAILLGSIADVMECLLTIVKDFIVGVASTAVFTALMAMGAGEIAIALIILIAVLDYFFFHPDPENALFDGTRNVIREGINAVI